MKNGKKKEVRPFTVQQLLDQQRMNQTKGEDHLTGFLKQQKKQINEVCSQNYYFQSILPQDMII